MELLDHCTNYIDFCHEHPNKADKFIYELSFRFIRYLTNEWEDIKLKEYFKIN